MDQNGSRRFQFNIFNIAILNTFWPFFTGIVVHLLAGMFQFARIILVPPRHNSAIQTNARLVIQATVAVADRRRIAAENALCLRGLIAARFFAEALQE